MMGISEAIDIDGTSDGEDNEAADASGIAEMKGSGGSTKSSKVSQIVKFDSFQSQIDIFIAYALPSSLTYLVYRQRQRRRQPYRLLELPPFLRLRAVRQASSPSLPKTVLSCRLQ